MNDHRPDETLNESAIDREIKAALSVDPSPEFLARVRTRIATEPAPAAWRFSWWLTAAGVVTATVVIAIVISLPGQRTDEIAIAYAPPIAATSETPVGQQSPAAQTDVSATAEVKTRADVRTGRIGVVSGLPGLSAVERSRTEPEVLFDPSEIRALRQLLDGVRSGQIDMALLPPEPPEIVSAIQPLGDIAPITIEPLESAAQTEGVRQ